MPRLRIPWLKYLTAILLGNGLYFALSPYLPPAAQHHTRSVDLGTIVDFWVCLFIYGVLELGATWDRKRRHPDSGHDQ